MARSEYTRLRDIAQKRLGRLAEAGLAPAGLSFPKLRDLKSPEDRIRAMVEVKQFVTGQTTLGEVKKAGHVVAQTPAGIVAEDPAILRRRERQREARQARKEALSRLTKSQRSMIKGAKTLGISIATKDLQAFAEYMEYRFSQYSDSRFYLFADYAEDFKTAKKKHGAGSILNDFTRFKQDYEQLHQPVSGTGYSAEEFQRMWNEFLD